MHVHDRSYFTFILFTALIAATACREGEVEVVYPTDMDITLFPDAPVYFDDTVKFPSDVPLDETPIPPLCPTGTERLFDNTFSPYIGGEESVDLEIISTSFFGCPHCAAWSETYHEVWQRREAFQRRVRIYFHHYPFSGLEPYEIHAAAHAAGLQNQKYFWSIHEFIYANLQNGYMVDIDDISDYVSSHLDDDFDEDQWAHDRDVDTNTILYHFLDWDRAQFIAQGVNAVPTVFICGVNINEYDGGRDNIEEIVDAFLNL